MNLAVIDPNGIVHNMIAVDETTLESTKQFWEDQGYTWVVDAICSIGDRYVDGQFISAIEQSTGGLNGTEY